MARRHQWNALTDEGRNDVYVELVELVGVKERGDQLVRRPSSRCVFPAWCADGVQMP
jgi:hypothetical protein